MTPVFVLTFSDVVGLVVLGLIGIAFALAYISDWLSKRKKQ